MLYGPSQQHVVAYRPSHSYPITTADDSLLAQAQPPFGELPYVHRDWLSHIANAAADPYLDSISQPFAVQDFCRSGTSSPAGISAGIGDEAFAESSGIVMPTKLHPRHAPVAGIARLITSWNPKLSIKPSNFVESAAPRLYISDDSISPPRPRQQKIKHRRFQIKSCTSCGEKDTPQWRGGPFGEKTLCNVCGLLHAKRGANRQRDGAENDRVRKRKRGLKAKRRHI